MRQAIACSQALTFYALENACSGLPLLPCRLFQGSTSNVWLLRVLLVAFCYMATMQQGLRSHETKDCKGLQLAVHVAFPTSCVLVSHIQLKGVQVLDLWQLRQRLCVTLMT